MPPGLCHSLCSQLNAILTDRGWWSMELHLGALSRSSFFTWRHGGDWWQFSLPFLLVGLVPRKLQHTPKNREHLEGIPLANHERNHYYSLLVEVEGCVPKVCWNNLRLVGFPCSIFRGRVDLVLSGRWKIIQGRQWIVTTEKHTRCIYIYIHTDLTGRVLVGALMIYIYIYIHRFFLGENRRRAWSNWFLMIEEASSLPRVTLEYFFFFRKILLIGLLGGGFKYFLFSPRNLGKIPILTNYFSDGLVQPPNQIISS